MARSDGDDKKPAKPKQIGGRNARLAAALRENLRRRKAQERQRSDQPAPEKPVAAPDKRADR